MSMRKMMTAACFVASKPEGARLCRRRTLACALAMLWPVAGAAPALAQTAWPERNVRIMVPVGAGTSPDVAARIFADRLTQRWGKPVLIENKPGAETTLGIGAFVSGRDDHTLLATVIGSYTTTPLLVDKMPYDTAAELVPITLLASTHIAYSVPAALPMRSLADVMQAARAQPGKLSWSSGPTILRFVPAAYMKSHGLDMPYVTYRDQPQSAIDLGESRIQVLVSSLQTALPVAQSGKTRIIAIANSQRWPHLPDVPTAAEAGFPELTVDGGAALFGWRGMSEALRDRIAADVTAVAAEPDVRRRLEASGQVAMGGTAKALVAALAKQQRQVSEIAKVIDLKAAK